MRLLPANTSARALCLATCLLTSGWALPAAAQESDPTAAERITRLYEQSRGAANIENYATLLAELEQIEALEISESQAAYLTSLASWIHTERGKKLAVQGDAAYNREDFDQGDELHDEALADFDAAVTRDPSSWKALHHRSVSRAMLSDYEGALADITAAIELTSEAPPETESDYHKLWFNQGKMLLDMREYEAAVASLTRLLEMTPNDATAVIGRGQAYVGMGDPRQALNDFNAVLSRFPNSAVALSARGEAYAALGQWEDAAKDLRKAVETGDGFATAYQRAAWFMATCPAEEFRQPALALQAAEAAIELADFDDWQNYDALAAAQARSEDFEAAQESISTAQALAEEEGAEYALPELAARAALYEQQQPYTLPAP